jgi:Secretion system C-terminal sorting domain/PKD domain
MGAYGAAIYWWEWDSDVHRKHYIALSSFMSGEDFESNKYFPQRDKDPNNTGIGGIESFTLVNYSGTRGLGWIQNRTAYWNTVPSCGSETQIDVGFTKKLKIKNLQAWPAKFTIDWYRTPENAPVSVYTSYTGLRTNLAGTLKLNVYSPLRYANDYAYKVNRTSSAHTSSTDKVFPIDTLDCPNDTLRFNGIFKNDTLGTQLLYNWNFGNGQTSTLAHPKVYYSLPGTYNVVLILTDLSTGGGIDTLSQQFVVLNCNTRNGELFATDNNADPQQVITTSGLKIYPNPNNGLFSMQLDKKTDADIFIYDVIGTLILQKHIVTEENQLITIDMKNKDKGLYLIKVIEKNKLLYLSKFIIN